MGTNITFCGSGFLGIYHIGVVSCLKTHAQKLLDKIERCGGCSAGALAACMLACNLDLEAGIQFVINQSSMVRKSVLGPFYKDFSKNIRESCSKSLPLDAYKRASGRLFISLTRVSDLKNVVVSEYKSNEDLIDVSLKIFVSFVYVGKQSPSYI